MEPYTWQFIAKLKTKSSNSSHPCLPLLLLIPALWALTAHAFFYLLCALPCWYHTENHMRLTHCLGLPLGPLGNWALRHSALRLRGSRRRMTLRQLDTRVVRNPPSGGLKKKKTLPVAPAFITSLGSALVTNTQCVC